MGSFKDNTFCQYSFSITVIRSYVIAKIISYQNVISTTVIPTTESPLLPNSFNHHYVIPVTNLNTSALLTIRF